MRTGASTTSTNAVMDLPAEYYLETVERVFHKHLLPRGRLVVHGERVRPEAIKVSALLTIEGELDDISGPGQTKAAHTLCKGIPARRKAHFEAPASATTASSPAASTARRSTRGSATSSPATTEKRGQSHFRGNDSDPFSRGAEMAKPVTPQDMFDLWQKMVNPGPTRCRA